MPEGKREIETGQESGRPAVGPSSRTGPLKDPRLIGFLAGFAGVLLIGVIAAAGLSALSSHPTPTLVPSALPPSERASLPSLEEAEQVTAPTSTLEPPATITSSPSPTSTRAAPISYTVQAGDTLFDIALAYGVSVETLQTANELGGETLLLGQVLVIPPGPLPTRTPRVEGGMIIHTVSSGETLIGIANRYSVTIEAIQESNGLTSDIIQPGWELEIPARIEEELLATLAPSPARLWQPSILEGDLDAAYPLSTSGARFNVHYQPDSPAARAPDQPVRRVDVALSHIEDKLGVSLEGGFDVYFAGSLFAPDNEALRGRTFSSQRKSFLLDDGSGTPEEREYIMTHELTHLVAWNTLGQPSSVMLHEGLAVYTGIEMMEAAGFMPLGQFCAAYQQNGRLPSLSGDRAYLGHIRDLDLYYTAGCFVTYLLEEYGVTDFQRLFSSGDYVGIYGKTFGQLEDTWLADLQREAGDLTVEPDDLTASIDAVAAAYDLLFLDFDGTPVQMQAYRELDRARITLLQGRLDASHEHLDTFHTLIGHE
jgi:LysM repeat protein